jgi:hypothetical protein
VQRAGNWNARAGNYLYPACSYAEPSWLCESSWSKDPQFQKQVKRAQECRQFQDKLAQASGAGREEITNAMKAIGCTAPLP